MIADSWFGPTTTAIAMYNAAGCYCILNVKTVHQHFLREELKGALNESDDVAMYMSNFTAADGKAVEIFASGQMEKQPLLLVASCSTDQPREPRVFTITVKESDGSTVGKTISYATTVVHGKYRGQFSAVDICNRICQGEDPFSDAWRTTQWEFRVIGELFGAISTNAFFAMRKWKAGCEALTTNQCWRGIAEAHINKPCYRAERASPGGPMEAAHVLNSIGEGQRKNCRMCGATTSFMCTTYSVESSGMYFGVCR